MATIFCDPNVVGGSDDGSSWEDAYDGLQEAITAATTSDEVWVKEGTFTLTASITLKDGVDVYLSFDSALTGTNGSIAGRNLSTDITYIDGNSTYVCLNAADCRVDGAYIRNGSGTTGAGIVADADTLDLYNCTIDNCDSSSTGGGFYAVDTSLFTLNNVVIKNCDSGGSGGAGYTNYQASFTNCIFDNNTSGGSAGALFVYGSTSFTDCKITNNTSTTNGGGVNTYETGITFTRCYIDNNSTTNDYTFGGNISIGNGTFTNCIIANGEAHYRGCGVYLNSGTGPSTFYNCVLADNVDRYTGTKEGVAIYTSHSTTLVNCIIWGNDNPSSVFDPPASFTITYSDDEGGFSGTGNISSNPNFVGTGENPYDIQSTSPCIDAGDGTYAPSTDYLGNNRYDDPSTSNTGTGTPNYTDIGAYEYQGVAGWTHKILGISNADISKINGISIADIAKVNNA